MTHDSEEERARLLGDAASQVQDVVLSLVAAARATLDSVERLARDPGPLVDAAARAAQTGREAAASWATAAAGAPSPDRPGDAPRPGDEDEDEDEVRPEPPRRPRVEHIRVEPADE